LTKLDFLRMCEKKITETFFNFNVWLRPFNIGDFVLQKVTTQNPVNGKLGPN
jgi:hypothetical protein